LKETNNIEELFRSKLANHETPVNDALWKGIQTKIAAAGATTTVSGGLSVLSKVIIGVSIAAAVTITTVLITNSGEPDKMVQPDSDTITKIDSKESDKSADSNSDDVRNIEVSNNNSLVSSTEEQEGPNSVNHNLLSPTDIDVSDLEVTPTPLDLTDNTSRDNEETDESTDEMHDDLAGDRSTEDASTFDNTELEDNQFSEDSNDSETPSEAQKIYLPDVFTPNGDGNNDEFFIETEDLTDYSLVVMDQRNNVVFQTSDPSFRWKGFDLGGNPVPEGQYIYVLTARDRSGESINRYSRLLIKR
jgi:gliding motility-associated-like protein